MNLTLEPMASRPYPRRQRTPLRPRTRINWSNVRSMLILAGMAAAVLWVLLP
jgi:hypothetical protein